MRFAFKDLNLSNTESFQSLKFNLLKFGNWFLFSKSLFKQAQLQINNNEIDSFICRKRRNKYVFEVQHLVFREPVCTRFSPPHCNPCVMQQSVRIVKTWEDFQKPSLATVSTHYTHTTLIVYSIVPTQSLHTKYREIFNKCH